MEITTFVRRVPRLISSDSRWRTGRGREADRDPGIAAGSAPIARPSFITDSIAPGARVRLVADTSPHIERTVSPSSMFFTTARAWSLTDHSAGQADRPRCFSWRMCTLHALISKIRSTPRLAACAPSAGPTSALIDGDRLAEALAVKCETETGTGAFDPDMAIAGDRNVGGNVLLAPVVGVPHPEDRA